MPIDFQRPSSKCTLLACISRRWRCRGRIAQGWFIGWQGTGTSNIHSHQLAASRSCGHFYMQRRLGKRLVVCLGGRENRFGRQSLLLVKDHFFFYKGYVSHFIWYLNKEKLFAPELEENRLC